jgi:hypothetical protein
MHDQGETNMTPDQRNAVRQIAEMFIDAVKVAGDHGAPGGTLYAAVLDKMNLSQFESIMGTLVKANKLRRSGHLYYFVADL